MAIRLKGETQILEIGNTLHLLKLKMRRQTETIPIKSIAMKTDLPATKMLIRVNYEVIPVNFEEIIFIKALADYVIVKTISGKYITLATMKDIQDSLPHQTFARSHRSYIVNLDKVSFVRGSNIEIIHEDYRFSIPIGRAFKKDFKLSLQAA